MSEKKPHANQYQAPTYKCVIHYTEGCEKYISEFQDKKVAMLRKHLEGLSAVELNTFVEMLEKALVKE